MNVRISTAWVIQDRRYGALRMDEGSGKDKWVLVISGRSVRGRGQVQHVISGRLEHETYGNVREQTQIAPDNPLVEGNRLTNGMRLLDPPAQIEPWILFLVLA